jgi:hypothetical protein
MLNFWFKLIIGHLGEGRKMVLINMIQNFQDVWLQKIVGELLMTS